MVGKTKELALLQKHLSEEEKGREEYEDEVGEDVVRELNSISLDTSARLKNYFCCSSFTVRYRVINLARLGVYLLIACPIAIPNEMV